ncbi:hypothetical protein JR316_0011631 [Psilocybe cubensis]|uniref:Uncharacterized protein n=2 Tax=Psilocybe cubensis TaxID=181762 RepID=A0A8H8CJI9_PSICU|nr:hypothetical protein JR316_0011631 [Psilocybe cubensis]KAH9476061.1 hypothetical protein JR316_0011631 [Psilocybe cubensis]
MTTRSIVVDDTDPRVQYSLGWFQDHGSQDTFGTFGPPYLSTLHGTTNGSLSFAFNGIKVSVIGTIDLGTPYPIFDCFLDNNNIGKAIGALSRENNLIICEKDRLVDGPHTLTVNATASNGQTFWFDSIRYVPSASVPLINEVIYVNPLDPALQYSNGWAQYFYGTANLVNMTRTFNSSVKFPFIGSSLSWYSLFPSGFPHSPTLGTYSVDDQNPVVFSLNSLAANSNTTLYNQEFFQTARYALGPHEITVTFLGNESTAPLSLNYLIIQNGTSALDNPSTVLTIPGPTLLPSSAKGKGDSTTDKSHTQGVIGGVVGAATVVIILSIAFYFIFNRRRRHKRHEQPNEGNSTAMIQPFCQFPGRRYVPVNHFHNTSVTASTRIAAVLHSVPTPVEAAMKASITSAPPPRSLSTELQSIGMYTADGPGQTSPINSLPTSIVHPPLMQRPLSALPRIPSENRPFPVPRPTQTVIHEDSGLRIPNFMAEDSSSNTIVEMPPLYTAN